MNHAPTARNVSTFAALLLAVSPLFAADPALPPVDPQMAETAKTAPAAPITLPDADAFLTKVQAALDKVDMLQCKLTYTRSQELLGDKQVRLGTLAFLRKPGPARFGIVFNKLIVDDRIEAEVKAYIFDGEWLVEKIPAQKQFFKRQISDPKAGPQEDLLESGKGPFIIPLTTKKDQILARFYASIVPANPKSDPDNTTHLKLVPKVPQNAEFTAIDIWYDNTTLFPRQVRTTDSSQNISEILLQEIVPNIDIDASRLDTSAPTEPGWRIEITPWENSQKPKKDK
jgi:hypothetical protein